MDRKKIKKESPQTSPAGNEPSSNLIVVDNYISKLPEDHQNCFSSFIIAPVNNRQAAPLSNMTASVSRTINNNHQNSSVEVVPTQISPAEAEEIRKQMSLSRLLNKN